ncbi:uncharacterized protein LOC133526622 [Cydia pomonella]|uniref:uncharacterized protein LOC133526622 n=1 Tax=Cydia pomonella TaxID=82600 RepID=UPI002ADD587B|nr:uncharacterized protein LOC133526622 [Cydia pomonella]
MCPSRRLKQLSSGDLEGRYLRIPVNSHMKYLGLVLDRRWNFEQHFLKLAPRIVGAASVLSRLLPNVGGPKAPCRRLYAGVVRSMAVYRALIWADRLLPKAKRPQVAALRIIRAYHTVSFAAACALAGTTPWELEAKMMAGTYRMRAEARARGERLDPKEQESNDRLSRD